MRKIKVIIKRSDEERGHSTSISSSYENLEKTVGGHIETVTIHKEFLPPELKATGDLVIMCNEEGWLLSLPENMNLFGYCFVGDLILAGVNGDGFADVPFTFANWRNYLIKRAGL